MKNDILYFGYGANMDKGMIKAITGQKNLNGIPAILYGYKLGVQKIDQIPSVPQKSLRGNWGDNFRSYVIFQDNDSKVKGVVWKLTETSRRLVRIWEHVDHEVGKEQSWYTQISLPVIETVDGNKIHGAETEIITEDQEVDESVIVNGLDYPPYLMKPDNMFKIASIDRDIFFKKEKNLI